ncbi:hypothetical protein DL96DRAFT_1682982 [Flagelloscypha sp. PMI_526]|nr:hypothetical protein DL96DRAFT_1682982 [Flagelloscypha sp. PMI_526]
MPSNVEIIRALYDEMAVNDAAEPIEKSPHFSDKFTCTSYPTTVGWPEMDKKGYIEHITRGASLMASRKVVVNEIIDGGDKVISHATATVTLKDGTEMVMDRIAIYSFDGEGKIVHFKQFVDSLNVSKMMEKFKPAA